MHNTFGIFLTAVLVMGILSYPAPITNSDYDNLSSFEVGLVGIAFADHENFDDDFDDKDFEDDFDDRDFEDEHEFDDKDFEDEHEFDDKDFEDDFDDRDFEDEHEFDDRDFEDEHEFDDKDFEDDFDDRDFEDEHDKSDDRERDENEKVKICHFSEGEDDNPITIEIARSATRPHLNHGDIFGGCEQFGIPDDDRDERPHDVPDDVKEQIKMVLDVFSPEELEEIMEEEGPRETASIIAEHTDLSFREAQKLVDFVMKEMEMGGDREHDDREKDHEKENRDFPKDMDDKIEIVMAEFDEEEMMFLMEELGPDQTAVIIEARTSLSIDEAREVVGFAMKMEKEDMRDNEEEDDFFGGVMEGDYPVDKYTDSFLGGITSGGESIGGWFGGDSDDVKDEPQKDESDDMFGGLFGFFVTF